MFFPGLRHRSAWFEICTPGPAMKLRVLVALGVLGCSSQNDGPLSWEEFQAQAYQEPESGIFIVNGDEPVEDEAELRDMYLSFVESYEKAELPPDVDVSDHALIVNRVNGQDDRWDATTAMNLTYCVSTKFGSRYGDMVSAMASAESAWEAVARVNFVHDASKDASCNARTTGVVFDVVPTKACQYYARAFFPSDSRRAREVVVAGCAFGDPVWTVAGILRHELGHTIGFRHEHTRPESGTCFEDNNWRALTAYDSDSVMHYPQCNGTQNGDLVLTNLDRTGAGTLYP